MASEADTEIRLRALILVIVALGIAAALAGARQFWFYVMWFYVPAAWTFYRPRWPQILVWIMWSVTWAMLGALLAIDPTALPFGSAARPTSVGLAIDARPGLMHAPAHWLVAAMLVLIVIGMPLVRRMHTAPPLMLARQRSVPEARVIRR